MPQPSSPETEDEGCGMDRAVLPLSFAVGSALGLMVISVRWLLVPLAKHHGLLGRLGSIVSV